LIHDISSAFGLYFLHVNNITEDIRKTEHYQNIDLFGLIRDKQMSTLQTTKNNPLGGGTYIRQSSNTRLSLHVPSNATLWILAYWSDFSLG
jgi:hypothetical protein